MLQALNDAAGSAFPGGPQALQRAGAAATQNERAINNALNDASRKATQNEQAITNGLEDAAQKSKTIADNMRQDLIDKWTHPMDPLTAVTEVAEAWAGNAFGTGAGEGLKAGLKGAGLGKALKAAVSAAAEEGKTTAGLGRAIKAGATAGSNGGKGPGQQQASNGQQSPSNSNSGPGASGNEEFPPAPAPLKRGMLEKVDETLRKIAKEKGWTIIVRDSNPGATRFYGQKGYSPKGPGLKAKGVPYDSSKLPSDQPNAGLASGEVTPEEAARGYATDPETGLVTQDGTHFYSDTDIAGVYDSEGNDVTDQFFDEIIKKQYRNNPIQDVIQHGTHDTWPFRNDLGKAGSNYGPQVGGTKSLTAYTPGSTVQLTSIPQTKAFYTQQGINWSAIYPNH